MAEAPKNDGCMRREASGHDKTGSISVFLVEELGDARVRCEQLKSYVDEALNLVETSEHRDHFFEVAGHLLHGIPEVLFKMEKALEAASMAASRIDYEEIKERLKPEKVDELEKALQDTRIRHPKRRSEGTAGQGTDNDATGKDHGAMNAKTAAYDLVLIADHVDRTGSVPMDKLISLIARLEKGKREASASGATPQKVSGYFRAMAEEVMKTAAETDPSKKPSRFALAQSLRRVVADQMPMTSAQVAAQIYQQATSKQDVIDGFREANPSMSEEDLQKAGNNWEKHKDVVKDKHQ